MAKTEERISLAALAYILKQEIKNNKEELCERTATKNQLKLVATIF